MDRELRLDDIIEEVEDYLKSVIEDSVYYPHINQELIDYSLLGVASFDDII